MVNDEVEEFQFPSEKKDLDETCVIRLLSILLPEQIDSKANISGHLNNTWKIPSDLPETVLSDAVYEESPEVDNSALSQIDSSTESNNHSNESITLSDGDDDSVLADCTNMKTPKPTSSSGSSSPVLCRYKKDTGRYSPILSKSKKACRYSRVLCSIDKGAILDQDDVQCNGNGRLLRCRTSQKNMRETVLTQSVSKGITYSASGDECLESIINGVLGATRKRSLPFRLPNGPFAKRFKFNDIDSDQNTSAENDLPDVKSAALKHKNFKSYSAPTSPLPPRLPNGRFPKRGSLGIKPVVRLHRVHLPSNIEFPCLGYHSNHGGINCDSTVKQKVSPSIKPSRILPKREPFAAVPRLSRICIENMTRFVRFQPYVRIQRLQHPLPSCSITHRATSCNVKIKPAEEAIKLIHRHIMKRSCFILQVNGKHSKRLRNAKGFRKKWKYEQFLIRRKRVVLARRTEKLAAFASRQPEKTALRRRRRDCRTSAEKYFFRSVSAKRRPNFKFKLRYKSKLSKHDRRRVVFACRAFQFHPNMKKKSRRRMLLPVANEDQQSALHGTAQDSGFEKEHDRHKVI